MPSFHTVTQLRILALVLTGIILIAKATGEVVFSTGFDYPAGSPTVGLNAANLDGADGQIGEWTGALPAGTNGDGGAEVVTIVTTSGAGGGDQMLRADRGTSPFTLVANLDQSVPLTGSTVSFDYATRRTDGGHAKDNHIVGFDSEGNESFHLIVSAKSAGAGDSGRLGYLSEGGIQWDLPTVNGADADGDFSYFFGSTDHGAIGSIALQLSETGFTVQFDNGDDAYTTSALAYNGSAMSLSRIEFTGQSPSGFWLDNILVEGTSEQLIRSFSSSPRIAAPGEMVTLFWELNAFDSLTLDGVDVSGQTDGDGHGSVLRTLPDTQRFELVATGSGLTETASLVVVASSIPVRITEVVSNNDNSLKSGNGSSPDWIELANLGSGMIDLGGWHLTDDPTALTKWAFPTPTLLSAGERIVVFASGGESHSGELHADFSLKSGGEYLALVQADGQTVAHEFAPLLPSTNEDVSFGLGSGLESTGFFEQPTPGEPNGAPTMVTGPVIRALTKDPAPPAPYDQAGIAVSVEVHPMGGSPVTDVTLFYRIGFEPEISLPMTADTSPEWSATVPTTALPPGGMIRWRAEAVDSTGAVTPFPTNVPADGSPRYHGTVASDSSIVTDLPILHWFVEDPDWYKDSGWEAAGSGAKPNNRNWTSASLLYDGQFYDNVQMRTRGVSAGSWKKPKFKVELNEGDEFQWSPGTEPVDEFNLQSHYRDQHPGSKSSYIREEIQMAFSREVGTPNFEIFHLHLRQNSAYFGLFSFTEQIDRTFLRRIGVDDEGALYKALNGSLSSGSGNSGNYRKSTRKDEPYTDLIGFIDGLNASDPARADFVFDHLDLPAIINKMAIDVILYNYDRSSHNYYVYHQPDRDEWTQFTWDTDLNMLVNDRFLNPDTNHPLFLDGLEGRPFNGLAAAILRVPKSREMYLRRLRNLMDSHLATTYLDDLITDLASDVATERGIDASLWGVPLVDVQNDLVDYYLPIRRQQLFETWSAVIPDRASLSPAITFGDIEVNPSSGNQDEEFIEIQNSGVEAVDLSDWTLTGGVDFTFPAGSVVPAGSSCFISPDVLSFRLRASTPTGGEQHLVLGNYGGHLSNFGELLVLADASGVQVAQATTPSQPSPNQLHLVVSEIMYHPEPDGDAEFIEVLNTSDSLTLDLSGVAFTAGIIYTFPPGTMLAPGERLVVGWAEFLDATSLSNGGETLKLEDADGSTIVEFSYDDTLPWPTEPDALGHSLVYLGDDPNLPSSWRASTFAGGNPGSSDTVPYTGGDMLVYALAGDQVFAPDTLLLSVDTKPGADEVVLVPQWSTDLLSWSESSFIYEGPNTWRLDRSHVPRKAFVRIAIRLR